MNGREPELVIALYQQGRSAREVGSLMSLSAVVVNNIVRATGVIRTPQAANRLASQRRVARTKIAALNLRQLAERWLAGAEVEELSAELGVPADLLWDALADELSKMGPQKPRAKLECAGTCSYGCTEQCTIAAPVSDRAVVPGTPRGASARRERGHGMRYARTGLEFPEPGPRSRWE